MEEILNVNSREEFREWLSNNFKHAKECWIHVVRKRPNGKEFTYIDAVEEALCFGWVDSVYKKVDGINYQRFSRRKKNSPWTELNKERARRLIKLGLMTTQGKKALPNMRYKEDEEVARELKKARVYTKFKSFPPLYQRVRMYNVSFYRDKDKEMYLAALTHLIEKTKKNEMYGEWNDYGRLLHY